MKLREAYDLINRYDEARDAICREVTFETRRSYGQAYGDLLSALAPPS